MACSIWILHAMNCGTTIYWNPCNPIAWGKINRPTTMVKMKLYYYSFCGYWNSLESGFGFSTLQRKIHFSCPFFLWFTLAIQRHYILIMTSIIRYFSLFSDIKTSGHLWINMELVISPFPTNLDVCVGYFYISFLLYIMW